MQDIVNKQGAFIVGVSVVVVPDGFVHKGDTSFGKVSLSLSPTSVNSPESVASVDIRFWPEQIAQIARKLRLHIEGQDRTLDRDADVDLAQFQAGATTLWRRLFSDGAGGVNSGFDALIRSLFDRSQSTFDKTAPVIANPTAEVARLIDGISGSAVAASFLQRAAIVAASANRISASPRTRFLNDATEPTGRWWKMAREEWLSKTSENPDETDERDRPGLHRAPLDDRRVMTAGISISDVIDPPLVSAHSDGEEEDASDSIRYLMEQIGEPEFWRVGQKDGKPQLGAQTVQKFLRAQPRPEGSSPRHRRENVKLVDLQEGAQPDPLRDAASRKFAGLLCFPTLAKYVGLIVDVMVEADFLVPGAPVLRKYSKIAATFTPPADYGTIGSLAPSKSSPAATHRNQTHATSSIVSPSPASLVVKPQRHVWTCYVVRRSERLFRFEYFGPKEQDETEVKPGGDGLLKLGGGAGKGRFELCTLDVTNAAEKFLDIARSSEGGKTLEDSRALPELLSRGIMLIDNQSAEEEKKRADRRSKRLEPTTERELYAEDLILGYRIDVVLTKKLDPQGMSKRDSGRWRTLVARSLSYGRDVDRRFLKLDAVGKQRARDDGYVRPMTRQDDNRKVAHPELFTWTGESLAIPHVDEAQIAAGARKPRDKAFRSPGIPLAPPDLTVDLIYDLPAKNDEAYRKPPPLRENRGYMFGARINFLNGCCLDFTDATTRYVGEEGFIIGDSSTEPYIYRRRSNVHAPDVLLPWNDRLVTSATGEMPKAVPGETIFDLVIRSGTMETDTASRLLVPPRVTFDLAEQSGLFDRASRPRAAFVGKLKAQMDHELGVFPVARSGTWAFTGVTPQQDPCRPQKTVRGLKDAAQNEESRGAVLVLDAGATRSRVDFYADPMARLVGVCFVKDGIVAPDLFPDSHRSDFWLKGSDSSETMPIILRLRKGPRGGKDHPLGWFDLDDSVTDIQVKSAGGGTRLKQITVVLAPGATVDLEIFSIPFCQDPTDKHHAVASALSLLRTVHDRSGFLKVSNFGLSDHHVHEFRRIVRSLVSDDRETQGKTCEELLSRRGLPQITTKRVVTLVHAVDRPPKPRFLTVDGTASGRLRFFPISISAGGADQSTSIVEQQKSLGKQPSPGNKQEPAPDISSNIQKRWQTYVTTQESWKGFIDEKGVLLQPMLDQHCQPIAVGTQIPAATRSNREGNEMPRLERACWDSEEGGLTTFFAGEILIDRLTTGRLRCDAKWLEYSPTIIRQDGVGGPWIAKAPNRYARLFEIDDIEEQAGLSDHQESSNHPEHIQKLDLLRKNSTNLRYLAYPFSDGRARHLTLQLTATSRFTSYFPKGTICDSTTEDLDHSKAKVWVPCTFRPAPPVIDHILPVFNWTNEVHDDGKEIRWNRESSLRLFMGRDWYSSGEGETLALVCWPKNLLAGTKEDEDRAASEISRSGLAQLDPPFDFSGDHAVSEKRESQNGADATHASSAQRYGQFITRWGADPIHLSGSLDEIISADRFQNFSQKVTKNGFNSDLLLSLPDSAASEDHANKPLAVCLLTYEPRLDVREGAWYADVTIDHGASYFPFIQLGLVRFQAHSASGLEMSYPVTAFAQLPPRRQGHVTFLNDLELNIELSGIGFHRSETEIASDPKIRKHDQDRYKSDVPALDIKLMSAADPGSVPSSHGKINWQPVLDRSGKSMEWLDERPTQRGAEIVWTRKIRLPANRRNHRYALLIEEFEYMAADVVFREPGTSDRPTFSTQLIRRGPVFSHIIDLTSKCQ